MINKYDAGTNIYFSTWTESLFANKYMNLYFLYINQPKSSYYIPMVIDLNFMYE
jgi:hypothetical protein